MARSENRERLPDWLESTWDAFRMNQMTQILERRLSSLEEAIIEIDLSGDSAFGNLEFAPLNHTHNEIEILDLGEGDYYVTVEYLENTFILDQISDVDLTGVQGGYVLTRNGANDGWIAAPASSGGAVFSPVITNPQLDDILIYNGSIWENAAPGDTPFVLRAGDSMEGNLNFPGELQLRFGSLTHRIGFSNSDNALLVGSTAGLDLSGTQVEVLS